VAGLLTGNDPFGNLFQTLMRRTDDGARPYSWQDIKAALEVTANGDWEGFYQSSVKGHNPLPLESILPLAGLRLSRAADGREQVEYDAQTSIDARNLWHVLIEGT
jgi:predicted metalloprotease with PDZ domain